MVLRTLGGLALGDGSFTRPLPLLLLSYLAVEGRKERRHLADLFWMDASDPLNRLSAALTKLRRVGPGIVDADATHVATAVRHDGSRLTDAVRAGRFREALEAYGGPFLDGVPPPAGEELEEWIFATREHFAALARDAHLGLADAAARDGRFAEAAAHAERAALLAGAPEPDGERLAHLLLLLAAGGSPRLDRLAAEAAELGVQPPASSADAQRRLLARATPAPAVPRPRLPAPPTAFVGRSAELARLDALLADPTCRLVTLLGPGGMGKTRLALRAAERRLDAHPDGVVFVPFASAAAGDPWLHVLAEPLGIAFHGAEDPAAQLLDRLAERRMLLVLDNLEHVLAGAGLLHELLERAPGIQVLATSRERLGLAAEWTLELTGMDLPDADDVTGVEADDAASDALQLFAQVARRRGRPLAPHDLGEAVRICCLVEGMPLAIELAGGWLDVLSVAEVRAEIERSLDFLASDARDVPDRQRSVRAAIEPSWARLGPDERAVFARLSVFRGGFSLDAARAVARADLRTLRALVGTSFVAVPREGRYAVHQLLGQYGAERLGDEEAERVRDDHAAYYLRLLARLEPRLKGNGQREALEAIDLDWRNVRAAWRHALAGGPAADAVDGALESLHLHADVRGRARQAAELFDEALAALPASPRGEATGGRLRTRRAFLRLLHGPEDPDAIAADLAAGLAVARRRGDAREEALATWALGILAVTRDGDARGSDERLVAALALLEGIGDRFYASRVANSLALTRFETHPLSEYVRLERQALAWATALGNRVERAHYLVNLTDATLMRGAYAESEASLRAAIGIGTEMRLHLLDAYARSMLGCLVLLRGEADEAADLERQAGAILRHVGYEHDLPIHQALAALVALLDGDPAEAHRLATASLHGRRGFAMGLDLIARWALALSHAARHEDAVAWSHVAEIAGHAVRLGPAAGTWILPVAALLSTRAGREPEAAELLALASVHPASPLGWQRRWAPTSGLLDTLRASLGAEPFERAWQRGRARDLTRTLRELAAPQPA